MIQCSSMDQDTKSAFEKLTKTMKSGFAALEKRIEKRFAAVEARLETGFAAVAEDIAEVKERLTAVESKIAGSNRRLDAEAMHRTELALPTRVADLEAETFGASRHPKHLPLK